MNKGRTSTKNNKKVLKNSTGPLRPLPKNSNINQKKKVNRNNNDIRLNKSIRNRESSRVNQNISHHSEEKDNVNTKKVKATTILKIVFFLAIIFAFIYLLFNLETFNLENIQVEGNTKYSYEQIVQNSNLKLGENVFKQLLDSDNKKVNLPYIANTHLNFLIPDTIVINVEERYPMYIALDSSTGKYYKIDNEGYLLEECELSSKKDELLVEGFTFGENVKFGEKINEIYIEKLEIYNSIKNEFENIQIEGSITKVNFSNSLTIVTLDDKLNIVFANNSNLNYKVSFLKGIMQKNGNNMEGTIDMSVEDPVYSEYN